MHTSLVWMTRWHESGEIHYMRINDRASLKKRFWPLQIKRLVMSLIESFSRKTIFPPFFPSFYPYFSFLVITVFQFFFSFPMCLPLIFSLSLWTSRIISRKQTRMKHPGTLNFRWERSNLQERTRQAQFAHILKKRAGIRIQWLVTIFGILASIHNISLNSGQRFFNDAS